MTTQAASAWAPQRALDIVAGTPPGGGLDRTARALVRAIEANRLTEAPVRVVNVAGDGGRKAWVHIDAHVGDPNVVGITSPNLLSDFLMGATTSDPGRFTPISILYTEYIAFVARPGAAAASGANLIDRFRRDAARVTVALSTSLGNPNHIALAKIIRHAGSDPKAPNIRVFDSALDAIADVVAGHAEVGAITAASAVPELAAGRPERLPCQPRRGPHRPVLGNADLDRAGHRLRRRVVARGQRSSRARRRPGGVLASVC